MRDGEWRLTYPGVDLLFGTGATPVFNRTTPELGDVDIRFSDVDRPRADGRAFGVDFRGGRTITFDLGVRSYTDAEVRREVELLAQAWRADAVRLTPGAVAELRVRYAGRERIVYGRPRRMSANLSDVAVNQFASVVADFTAVDDLFYSTDLETTAWFGVVPRLGGGLVAPLSSPLTSTLSSDRSMGLTVSTEMPAWPIVEIRGPITNPVVDVVGAFHFDIRRVIGPHDTLVIDTRPWARSALINGTANIAGTVRGTRLSQATLDSGSYEVGIKGIDPTGTAALRLSWRAAYASI